MFLIGGITVNPSTACIGDNVTVTCSDLDYLEDLNIIEYQDVYLNEIKFFVGDSSNSLSLSQVNYGATNPLNRITAQLQINTGIGILTLSSFTSSDDGLLIGCVGLYHSDTIQNVEYKQITNLQAAGILCVIAVPYDPINNCIMHTDRFIS